MAADAVVGGVVFAVLDVVGSEDFGGAEVGVAFPGVEVYAAE